MLREEDNGDLELNAIVWNFLSVGGLVGISGDHNNNPPHTQYMPLIQYNPCDCSYLSRVVVTLLNGFPWIRWLRRRFSESSSARIWVKISEIRGIRVIMGIMTGLLGLYLWSTLGLSAKVHVKIPASHGFWLQHPHWVPECLTNNARAAPIIISFNQTPWDHMFSHHDRIRHSHIALQIYFLVHW